MPKTREYLHKSTYAYALLYLCNPGCVNKPMCNILTLALDFDILTPPDPQTPPAA